MGGSRLTPALRLRHISKSFGGVRALDDAHLEVLPGEVHGLLGENGSGKSTLIKVLAGYHDPDPGGELDVGGQAARLPLRPGEARTLGLAFVHQDLGLIPSLTALENLRLTELAARRGWRISWRHERSRAAETFARYGVDIDPRAIVDGLRPVQRAQLAIVRAMGDLSASGGVLVLDEPSAFLPRAETERLFALVRSIAETGTTVVFVSHDLGEVRELTDRVTVLRDGRTVGTAVSAETSTEELVAMIVGGRGAVHVPERPAVRAAEPFVSVEGLRGGVVEGVSFAVSRGEILGLTGLAGSGFQQVLHLLYGGRRAEGGTLTLGGAAHDLTRLTPAAALEAGIALVSSDRRDGAVGSLPISDNLLLPVLDRYRARHRLQRRRMVVAAGELLRRFGVRPSDPRLGYEALSGGNQQKALLAKWLQTEPSLLLLDEPTRGVDVGARPQIWALVRQAAGDGAAVVCASSDAEELATLCDRVIHVGERARAT